MMNGLTGLKASLYVVRRLARSDAAGKIKRGSGRVVVTEASAEGETPHEALTNYIIPCFRAKWQITIKFCNVCDASMLHKVTVQWRMKEGSLSKVLRSMAGG